MKRNCGISLCFMLIMTSVILLTLGCKKKAGQTGKVDKAAKKLRESDVVDLLNEGIKASCKKY